MAEPPRRAPSWEERAVVPVAFSALRAGRRELPRSLWAAAPRWAVQRRAKHRYPLAGSHFCQFAVAVTASIWATPCRFRLSLQCEDQSCRGPQLRVPGPKASSASAGPWEDENAGNRSALIPYPLRCGRWSCIRPTVKQPAVVSSSAYMLLYWTNWLVGNGIMEMQLLPCISFFYKSVRCKKHNNYGESSKYFIYYFPLFAIPLPAYSALMVVICPECVCSFINNKFKKSHQRYQRSYALKPLRRRKN
jgi:hypothetical protein